MENTMQVCFYIILSCFTYLHQYNCTMYLGDSEIICNLISDFVIRKHLHHLELNSSNLILLIH